MKFTITRRWFSSLPSIEVELGTEFDGANRRIQLGAAVKVALNTGADLRGAVLTGAVLTGADITGAVLTGAVLTGVVLTDAVLRGADLTGAFLTDADLRGADLTGADLTDAVLTGADLTGAVLTGAVLTGADLRGADLTGAVLTGAVLTGADLTGADLTGVPVIPNIDLTILAAIENGGRLRMANWHTCETTHCRAGWAIHLAGEAGLKLEKKHGSAGAGALIYAASRPGKPIPNFYASDAVAMADIRACAAEIA